MPYYDFKCPKCKEIQEITTTSDKVMGAIVTCTKCGIKMVRDWSTTAKVKFNGSGFSCNDLNGRSQKII